MSFDPVSALYGGAALGLAALCILAGRVILLDTIDDRARAVVEKVLKEERELERIAARLCRPPKMKESP
ncbi:MAG: hypothetical protein ABFC38_14965 [Methanospirillum sp.]